MARLTEVQVRDLVRKALSEVADFPPGSTIDDFTFDKWNDFHKEVFCAALKQLIVAEPYLSNDGGTVNNRYHDIALSPDSVKKWKTIADCIKYILKEQSSPEVVSRDRVVYP